MTPHELDSARKFMTEKDLNSISPRTMKRIRKGIITLAPKDNTNSHRLSQVLGMLMGSLS